MDFSYSENQKMIADMIRKFGEEHIKPKMMEWDEKQEFPVDVFRKLGELGLMGVLIPEEYGGSGLGYNEYITVVSEIAKVCGSIGLSVAAHNSLCTNHIYKFASEELKKKYLPKLASGQWIGAWGLTEANTGSDSGNMKCVAVRDGDQWIINGTKNWITHGKTGDVAVVLCRTGEPRAKNNITAFAIERGTKGFSAGKKENKLGMRASETTELVFDNCVISDSQRLGEVGDGFKQAMKILDGGRISIAALALGIAKGAFEASIKYSKERIQFDQPIANFQAIQWKLADMATQIEAAELLIYQAADLLMRGERVTKQSAFAKYYASEISVKIATDAVQIFGGYGYTKDFPVEKYYRDSKLCTIGEGTSEIQKLVISRDILS
ncbi:MAG: acyl-CoA dehydrogenase family protein [Chitinophagaceae bacterium]|nr:acyl-CoA dehydrogenase family protein [Chitinophagaceae bacterium]